MKFEFRSTAFAALSAAALLLLSAAPARAQQSEALGIGHGTFMASTQDVGSFDYIVRQHSDGTADGYGFWHIGGTYMLVRLTSSMVVDGAQAVAGPILWIGGTPPPPQFGIEVGGTSFFAVQDNGPGSLDRTTGFSAVPAAFGQLSIQMIIGMIGAPPPAAYRPLLSGNIWFR